MRLFLLHLLRRLLHRLFRRLLRRLLRRLPAAFPTSSSSSPASFTSSAMPPPVHLITVTLTSHLSPLTSHPRPHRHRHRCLALTVTVTVTSPSPSPQGAVKYADLKSNRISNYAFSYERMLAFEGNTAVYLLYAGARMSKLLRDSGESLDSLVASGATVSLQHDAERMLGTAARSPQTRTRSISSTTSSTSTTSTIASPSSPSNPVLPLHTHPLTSSPLSHLSPLLHAPFLTPGKELLRFGEVIEITLATLQPNFMCDYLYGLCGVLTTFYVKCRVRTPHPHPHILTPPPSSLTLSQATTSQPSPPIPHPHPHPSPLIPHPHSSPSPFTLTPHQHQHLTPHPHSHPSLLPPSPSPFTLHASPFTLTLTDQPRPHPHPHPYLHPSLPPDPPGARYSRAELAVAPPLCG